MQRPHFHLKEGGKESIDEFIRNDIIVSYLQNKRDLRFLSFKEFWKTAEIENRLWETLYSKGGICSGNNKENNNMSYYSSFEPSLFVLERGNHLKM